MSNVPQPSTNQNGLACRARGQWREPAAGERPGDPASHPAKAVERRAAVLKQPALMVQVRPQGSKRSRKGPPKQVVGGKHVRFPSRTKAVGVEPSEQRRPVHPRAVCRQQDRDIQEMLKVETAEVVVHLVHLIVQHQMQHLVRRRRHAERGFAGHPPIRGAPHLGGGKRQRRGGSLVDCDADQLDVQVDRADRIGTSELADAVHGWSGRGGCGRIPVPSQRGARDRHGVVRHHQIEIDEDAVARSERCLLEQERSALEQHGLDADRVERADRRLRLRSHAAIAFGAAPMELGQVGGDVIGQQAETRFCSEATVESRRQPVIVGKSQQRHPVEVRPPELHGEWLAVCLVVGETQTGGQDAKDTPSADHRHALLMAATASSSVGKVSSKAGTLQIQLVRRWNPASVRWRAG